MSKRAVGQLLVVAAIALGIAAYFVWSSETERAESEARVQGFAAAIGGGSTRGIEPEPDRTLAFVLIGAGVLSAVCGTIVLTNLDED